MILLPVSFPIRRACLRSLPGILTLAALAAPSTGLGQEGWSVAGEMPLERGQTAAVAAAEKVYLLTGSSPEADATGLLQEWNPRTGEWGDLTPMPDIASHAGAAVLDGRIYVVGGFIANVHVGGMERVFEYDIAADTWRALPPLAVPRGSPGVIALDGRIHAIGGRDDEGVVDAHEVYDPAAGRWTRAAPLPLARDHLGIEVADGRIHVFGGRTAGSSANTGRHDIYDPATDGWTEGPPMPTPRSGGMAFRLGDLLVYAGGECREPRATYDEVEGFDPGSGRWLTLPPLPEGRHAGAAAAVGNVAYVIGGRTGCGGDGPMLDVLALSGSSLAR